MTSTERFIIVTLIVAVLFPCICYAESAEVLPKGVFSFDATYYHYFDIKKRYNPDGDSEDLAVDYNRNLNSNVFPDLAPLDPLVGGEASIGRSVVKFEWIYRWFEFSLAYGITDKLSIGVLVPYNYSKNKVNARLDSSTANVGKNPLYGTPGDPFGSPIIPIAFGGIPLIKEDVLQLLGRGLDVNGDSKIDIPGFGYKRFETWSDSMLGDIEVSAKYQFYNKGDWRFAGTVGLRLPTGKEDDPDNLLDLTSGDGQTDILLRVHADYVGIKKLLLNTTIRYDIQLADKETLRVPDSVDQPITTNKEKVDRNLGDILEFDVMGNYSFTSEIFGGLQYRFAKKFKDSVSGHRHFAYSSLEEETDPTSHMIFATLGYSTVQKYLDKKFKVPFTSCITYRYRFAGTNNVTKSQYIALNLAVYF